MDGDGWGLPVAAQEAQSSGQATGPGVFVVLPSWLGDVQQIRAIAIAKIAVFLRQHLRIVIAIVWLPAGG